MADGNIVDNSPELPLDDPKVAEFLAQAEANRGTPKPVKPDVKQAAPASSAEPKVEEESDESDDPEHLKARIRGLQAELTRRKGNSERVDALESQIAELKAQASKPASTQPEEFDWIRKLDNEALASKQTDWDDELADARAKYGRAEESGDERAMERQGQRILNAKRTLSAFRRETLDRTRRIQDEAEAIKTETQSIQSEIAEMHDACSEQYPDFLDPSTELWKAGNEEFVGHPALMARLGPLGEVVAAAMAIVRNPELVGKKATASARREVLGGIEKSVKKALTTGASAPTTSRSVDVNVESGEGLAAFNRMIDRIKGG